MKLQFFEIVKMREGGRKALQIYPSKALKTLLALIIFLALVSMAGLISTNFFGHNRVFGLVPLFRLSSEGNVPAWYSSTTLFVCSLLLAIIAFTKKIEGDRYRLHWSALSIIFLYLAIDEGAMVHEALDRIFSANIEKIFPYATYLGWTGIAIPFVLIFLVVYIKFFIDLPKKTQLLFLLSGFLYVYGTIGMELISQVWYLPIYGKDLMYQMIASLEEILEMLGIAVFIYALLSYIGSYVKEIVIRVSEENDDSGPMK